MKKSDNDLIRVRNVKALFESYLTTLRSADYYSDSEKACISGVLSVMQRDIMDLPTIEQPKWIRCDERLPDEEGEYIVMTNATGKTKGVLTMRYRITVIRNKPVRRWEWLDRISVWKVTHWMPIPQPPKWGDE